MKKALSIIIPVLVSIIITFVLFEALSWYHFGDVPTTRVVFRLLGCALALSGLSISVVAFIQSRKKN
jgi:hypothetical protein